MLGQKAKDYLNEIGCCIRCILIYFGEKLVSSYENPESIKCATAKAIRVLNEQTEETSIENGSRCPEESTNKSNETSVNDNSKMEINLRELNNGLHNEEHCSIMKRPKYDVCITCLGMLQSGCSKDAVLKMSEFILQKEFDASSFSVQVSLPISIALRVHWVWALLLKVVPQFPVKNRTDHLVVMKDVYKNLLGPKIGDNLGKEFLTGANVELSLNMNLAYKYDEEDCKMLDTLYGKYFEMRRVQHRKFNNLVYTRSSIESSLKKIDDADIQLQYPEPPSVPQEPVTYENMQCQHTSIYMAGRYNKYSRELSQTPWFVEDGRRMDSSVQELIVELLNSVIKADSMKFSSSGREDVDVRCLGNGRPFVVEFVNPHRVQHSQEVISLVQKKINESSQLIRVRDLQIVSKKNINNLKAGEEGKTKSYIALCLVKSGCKTDDIEKLNHIKDLMVMQETPLRVLHRRPLATRPRMVHIMHSSPLNDNFFKLSLTTQAGTYIKEFVHGDFGRTLPNLRTILGYEVDIVALDVESISLDWPPKLDS